MEEINKYISVIEDICERVQPGKKMLQKLMYLMERRTVALNLNYSIHFFGPYSSKLDNIVHILESKEIIEVDTSGKTHKISVNDAIDISHEYSDKESKEIKFVLDNFANKTALELEALTTLDYVANTLLENRGVDEEIIEGVVKIKGSKFTRDYLNNELKILKKYSFI